MSYSWNYTGNLDKWGGGGTFKLSGPVEECTNDADYGQVCAYKFTPTSAYNLAAASSGLGSTNQTLDQNRKPINSMGGSLGGGSTK